MSLLNEIKSLTEAKSNAELMAQDYKREAFASGVYHAEQGMPKKPENQDYPQEYIKGYDSVKAKSKKLKDILESNELTPDLKEGVKHTPELTSASIRAAVAIIADTKSYMKSVWNDPKSGAKKEFSSFDEFLKAGIRKHTDDALKEFSRMLAQEIAGDVADLAGEL